MRSLRGKRILVTGGAGFIGSHLVDRLIDEEPASIIIVDNFYLGRESNLDHAVERADTVKILRLDAGSLSSMQQVVRDERIDVAFNLAVVPLPTSLTYPAWTVRVNIDIALVSCELARCGDIETLVHYSSSEAYGSALYVPMDEQHPMAPCTPYAASKEAADQIVLSYHETFGIDATIVRPFNNYGPRQNAGTFAGIIPIVVRCVTSGETIRIFGDGEQTRDYIYAPDTAEATVKLYETEQAVGCAVNVSSGQEISVNELVSRLVCVMGVPDHPIVHEDDRAADVRRHCGDTRRLAELTGYSPAPITDERLLETANWYQRSGLL